MVAEVIDITANLTLGEIRARDIDNFKLVLKSCKEYAFPRLEQAAFFIGKLTNLAMEKLGVDQKAMWEKLGLDPGDVKKSLDSPIAIHHHQPAVIDPRIQRLLAMVDKTMLEKDVKVERRQYHKEADMERSGIYIYHRNEIAYFFSEPFTRKGGHYATPNIIVPSFGKWFVLTNFGKASANKGSIIAKK